MIIVQTVAIVFVLLAWSPLQAQTVCDARQYGAKGDGVTKDTAAIQAAIDTCAQRGGTVRLSAGTFVSGPLDLRSNITLQVEKDAVLAASTDHNDFPEFEEFNQPSRRPLINADHVENITILGGGIIDGRGESWWSQRAPGYRRPRLVVFRYCKHIRMENITVQNSPSWQIVPYYSDDLIFRNMKVIAPEGLSHNTDGIDPFSSGHVRIDHVLIDTGDDNIAIKSGQPGSLGPDAPSHDIMITDCELLHGHGLSVGSEVAGGVRNLRVERVHFKGTGNGIRIKSNRDRGNDIGNFVYRDLVMDDVATPITISEFYPSIPNLIEGAPVTRLTPHFHDIKITNLRATNARDAAIIVGLPESPIRGLKLTNVHISARKGAQLQYADVVAKDFVVTAAEGNPVVVGPGVRGKIK
ncbi:MAG: glycoside hydrolase family 28 protein [Terracidiphilus sp.]|jgi:polygalacturonase